MSLSSVMYFKFTLHRRTHGKHSMSINIEISVFFNVSTHFLLFSAPC